MITVTLTSDEVSVLESAIEAATIDHSRYMEEGNPENDYAGYPGELEGYKQYPARWAALLVKLQGGES